MTKGATLSHLLDILDKIGAYHWHLDVTFKEDNCRARTGHAAENLNIMRKVALHRLAQAKVKISLKKRRFRASLNQDFLELILDL